LTKSLYSDWIEKLRVAQGRNHYRDQTPESLELLVKLARRFMPTRIVELGTHWGLSLRAWVHADTGADIISVDWGGFRGVEQGYDACPFDLSRVTALKADVRSLRPGWGGDDRVLLYCDVHGVEAMRHIVAELLPSLPPGSLVIIDDIWDSDIGPGDPGRGDLLDQFFDKCIAPSVDPDQPDNEPRSYSRYWATGNLVVGFEEINELMNYVNRERLDCRFEAKTMWFYANAEPITAFTTCKPFVGETATMQRNAIESWTRLQPRPEIIIFGDDEGAGEAAYQFNVRHEPTLEPKIVPPRVDVLFKAAERLATNTLMMYVNADIILDPRLSIAAQTACREVGIGGDPFLMTGLRWDLIDWHGVEIGCPDWWEKLARRVDETGQFHASTGADYFLFHQGLYPEIPEFYIGQSAWDNWLIMDVVRAGLPVVDATGFVQVVHQGLTRCDIKDPRYKHNQKLWHALDPQRDEGTIETAQWAIGGDGRITRCGY
jgi:hypothetical protein